MRQSSAPVTPRADAARRTESLGIACLIGQFFLSLAAGAWAAGIADDGGGAVRLYAAMGLVAGLVLAHVAANGFRLLAALVIGAISLPGLLKRLESQPVTLAAIARNSGDNRRSERIVNAVALLLHGAVLLAAASLVAGVIAATHAIGFLTLWWRFALAAAVLMPLTRRGLMVMGP